MVGYDGGGLFRIVVCPFQLSAELGYSYVLLVDFRSKLFQLVDAVRV